MTLPKHANKTSQVPVKNLSDYDIVQFKIWITSFIH